MILKFWAKISNGISRLSKSRRAVDQLPMNLPPDRIIEMLKNMFEVCIGTFLSQQENTNITASHILGLDQINEEGMNIDLFIQILYQNILHSGVLFHHYLMNFPFNYVLMLLNY